MVAVWAHRQHRRRGGGCLRQAQARSGIATVRGTRPEAGRRAARAAADPPEGRADGTAVVGRPSGGLNHARRLFARWASTLGLARYAIADRARLSGPESRGRSPEGAQGRRRADPDGAWQLLE